MNDTVRVSEITDVDELSVLAKRIIDDSLVPHREYDNF